MAWAMAHESMALSSSRCVVGRGDDAVSQFGVLFERERRGDLVREEPFDGLFVGEDTDDLAHGRAETGVRVDAQCAVGACFRRKDASSLHHEDGAFNGLSDAEIAVRAWRIVGEVVEVVAQTLTSAVPFPGIVQVLSLDDVGNFYLDLVNGVLGRGFVVSEDREDFGIGLGQVPQEVCAFHVAEQRELFVVEIDARALV